MQTITKQDILKGLPDRWLRQYPLNHYNASSKYEGDLEKFAKGKRLKKLRDEGLLTIELANKTIGNDRFHLLVFHSLYKLLARRKYRGRKVYQKGRRHQRGL